MYGICKSLATLRLLATRAPACISVNLLPLARVQQSTRSLSYTPPFENDPADYRNVVTSSKKKLASLLSSKTRFQRISEREDRSDVPPEYNKCISKGRHLALYRGVDACKCPLDFVLYHQLFYYVQPKTVIELGSYLGGSALWITDTLNQLKIPCQVYSMDIDLSQLSKEVLAGKADNLTFLQGNSFSIENTFSPEFLSSLPHPWVIIEDAHANKDGILRYFHQHMHEGDYFAFEDTGPHIPCKLGMYGVFDVPYEELGTAALEELKTFLKEYEDYYSVDSFITDMFGYNCSWHWHGFIRKMK